MKLHHHVAFSATISLLLYMIFKSWYLSLVCLLSGVFIDLDHFIDYFREQGINLDMKKFFSICDNGQFDRVILLFHGWEWVILIGVLGWSSGWNPLTTGLVIGIGHHLVLDAFYNGTSIKAYSILWRWSKGFDFDTTFPSIAPVKYNYRKSLDRN